VNAVVRPNTAQLGRGSMVWAVFVGILLAAGALVFCLARGRNQKVVMTREEVAAAIQAFLDGAGGAWDWDDFISTPIEDLALDRIRVRCAVLSAEFPTLEGYCAPQGLDVLRAYVRELREKSA
jgi:hypothetical protein